MTTVSTDAFDLQRIQRIRKWAIGLSLLAVVVLAMFSGTWWGDGPTHETVEKRWHYVYQDGPSVFKFAVKNMADVSAEIMERNHLKGEDVAWLVPHQANKRIIDATAQRMGINADKVMMTIHKYGNTTAATIPLCLFDYESQLKKGDNLVLAAFGGGFTWGAAYVKWAY